MRAPKTMFILACVAVSFVNCQRTPGQKLDYAIDATKQSARRAQEKYEDAKETAKKKSDQAREDLADRIRP